MKIAMGSDHAGFNFKEEVKKCLLEGFDFEVEDLGPDSAAPVDYPDYAHKVAIAVARGEADYGVLICGSGIGMCMAANRHNGVRAVVLQNEYDAEMSRLHNDANVACLGARTMDAEHGLKLLKVWFETNFGGERHQRRINKIDIS